MSRQGDRGLTLSARLPSTLGQTERTARDYVVMNPTVALASAASELPEVICDSVRAALASGDFNIGAGTWQSELAVCPIAAAALSAGVWENGAITDGAAEWGTPDGPSAEVEEFAAWFDICAEDEGLDVAIGIVRASLAVSTQCRDAKTTTSAGELRAVRISFGGSSRRV